ncbi:hypothetical protein C4577_07420 [Candidatus Parcubacteria bacterium]|nr:MAG: hypothetical protein C4577_07420 [Candidatus Parcubacteria bacterium]
MVEEEKLEWQFPTYLLFIVTTAWAHQNLDLIKEHWNQVREYCKTEEKVEQPKENPTVAVENTKQKPPVINHSYYIPPVHIVQTPQQVYYTSSFRVQPFPVVRRNAIIVNSSFRNRNNRGIFRR